MTTEVERYNAIKYARQFVYDAMHNDNLPEEIREQAYAILKYYPSEETMKIVCMLAPELFKEKY